MWPKKKYRPELRPEAPLTLHFEQVRLSYAQRPNDTYNRLVYLIIQRCVENEHLGRLCFEEDVCPPGLLNYHFIECGNRQQIILNVRDKILEFNDGLY